MTFWNLSHAPEALASLDDERLCREVRAGNHQAFLELFDRYWRQVFRLASAIIRDEAEAEDLAQALFLEVHRNLLQFDPQKGSFRTLLFRYAYTRAIDQRRRLKSRHFYSNVPLEDLDASSLANGPSFSWGYSMEEGTQLIRQAMEHLDEKQRATVEAYFFRGLSLNEIAEELGDSFGNARHHLYRGLAKMRKLLLGADGKEKPAEASRSISSSVQNKMPKRLASEV
jgi:RNA polymerase sigma-70 factor (ECF subfamily)